MLKRMTMVGVLTTLLALCVYASLMISAHTLAVGTISVDSFGDGGGPPIPGSVNPEEPSYGDGGGPPIPGATQPS